MAMLLMAVSAMAAVMAVAITALGGTSIYPWIFLGTVLVTGVAYAFLQQRRQAHEAQIQSSRQITINFINGQYQVSINDYARLLKPHETSASQDIKQEVLSSQAEYQGVLQSYNHTLRAIAMSNEQSDFETLKNSFCLQLKEFQQSFNSHIERIREVIKEQEHKEEKIRIMTVQDKKHKELEVRFKAIAQTIPTSDNDVHNPEKFRAEMRNIITDLGKKWSDYLSTYKSLQDDFHQTKDPSEEFQKISDIGTLSSDLSKDLQEVKTIVEDILQKHAITETGRLARETRDISTHVPNSKLINLQIYGLTKQLIHEVKRLNLNPNENSHSIVRHFCGNSDPIKLRRSLF